MRLNQLLKHLTYEHVQGSQSREITDICYHSGNVREGSLFVCLKGLHNDGHDYLQGALEAGAAAVVVAAENVVPLDNDALLYTEQFGVRISEVIDRWQVSVVIAADTRHALAELAAAFFDYPAAKLRMVGITGTKGKTTTAYLLSAILRESGHKTGMIGTIAIDTGDGVLPAVHTTPEAYEIQKYLAQMVDNGCDTCVMEVSSQGLKMQRVEGIFFDIGMFLNIELDHIGEGEHASFAEYLFCKSRLMRQCRIGIVNRDDPHTERILQGHTCSVETFSMRHPADVTAENIRFFMQSGELWGSFLVRGKTAVYPVRMQLPGTFNVYNALAAIRAAGHLGAAESDICLALRSAKVPGRCENVRRSEDYVILIDYAHNEMSLKNLLEMLRGFKPRRLIVLFGCGGNRSKLRRSKMGETAGHLADLTILTSDNPRWEDPEEILDDIEDGIRGTGGQYVRIADRREAVRYAMAQAMENDMLVLAGKGHEAYQEIRGVRYPLSEYELVEEARRSPDMGENTDRNEVDRWRNMRR